MLTRCILALSLAVWVVTPAQADYPDEHPEYFGITSPPPTDYYMPSLFDHDLRYAVRVGDLDIYGELHLEMAGEKLLFVAGGAVEMSQLEAYLTEFPLQAESVGYIDVGQLDGKAIGDFYPLYITNGDGARLVDPRYAVKSPHDDAAGSTLAELWETCAYRPPVFLNRGYIISTGDGRCVVARSIYARSPGVTEAEVNGQLAGFLGCQQVIALQALQQDGEGRLDTFVRLAAPGVFLVGQYETVQDSANQLIMSQGAAALAEAYGEEYIVDTVAMPDPIILGNETLRPSYLHYIATKSRLIVPTFKNNESWQAKAYSTLQKHHSGLDLVSLDATELTYGSSRLTSIIAPYPDLTVEKGCEGPEMICDSGSALECDGLCFNECWKTGKLCVNPTDYGKCAKADDSCYDLEVIPCPEESACVDNGNCEAGPGDCADIPPGGTCDGDSVKKCVGDTVITVDCGANGQFCTLNEALEAICYLPCFDDCVPETTFCDSDAVYYCEPLPEGGEGCGQRTPVEVCDDGMVCADGACVTPAVEPTPDVTADDGGSVGAENQDWTAGYQPKDNGCAAGATGPVFPVFLVLVLVAIVLAARYRGSIVH